MLILHFQLTDILPATTTENQLSVEGFYLNGPLIRGLETFIICYRNAVPHLLKVLSPTEFSRVEMFHRSMASTSASNEFLIDFILHDNHSHLKHFMIMLNSRIYSKINKRYW